MAPRPGLEVSDQPIDGAHLLEVAGDVDLATVHSFVDRLLAVATGDRRIVLDLSEVGFMDATMVNALYASVARVRRAGGDLVIVSPPGSARRLLELVGLDAVYAVVDTREEALAKLRGRANA